MLDLFSRQAYHMKMKLQPIPEEAPSVFLSHFLDPILAKIDSQEAVHLTQRETRAMRARAYHLDYDNQILFLLINFADKNIGDPAFEHLETGSIRIEPKLRGEGIAVSTYMAIDLIPENDRTPHYKVVLEDVPGIGRSKLCPFLTHLAKITDVRVETKDPEGKRRRARPDFSLEGSMSQTLDDDLKEGTISFVELVRYKPDADFDEQGVLEQERSTLRIKVRRVPDDDNIGLLNRLLGKAHKKGYTEMRVGYSPAKDRSKTVDFGTARDDVADVLTIKTSEVRLTTSRLQCEQSIRSDVVEKLTELVLQRRNEET